MGRLLARLDLEWSERLFGRPRRPRGGGVGRLLGGEEAGEAGRHEQGGRREQPPP
jgi:hypothetical protein